MVYSRVYFNEKLFTFHWMSIRGLYWHKGARAPIDVPSFMTQAGGICDERSYEPTSLFAWLGVVRLLACASLDGGLQSNLLPTD